VQAARLQAAWLQATGSVGVGVGVGDELSLATCNLL